MKLRPKAWPLPRPKAIHHMVEDFLAEWDAPISHIQPLRRFLEHCVQTDLRAFYAGTVASGNCSVRCPAKHVRLRKCLLHQGVGRGKMGTENTFSLIYVFIYFRVLIFYIVKVVQPYQVAYNKQASLSQPVLPYSRQTAATTKTLKSLKFSHWPTNCVTDRKVVMPLF